jgi:hypothetical protein
MNELSYRFFESLPLYTYLNKYLTAPIVLHISTLI